MDWPRGDKLYHVEKMIEAGKNPNMTLEQASKVIDYAAAYIYSLPEDIQDETAKRLVSEMGGGAERVIGVLLTPELVQNVGTSAQVPTLPYTSKIKIKKAKL